MASKGKGKRRDPQQQFVVVRVPADADVAQLDGVRLAALCRDPDSIARQLCVLHGTRGDEDGEEEGAVVLQRTAVLACYSKPELGLAKGAGAGEAGSVSRMAKPKLVAPTGLKRSPIPLRISAGVEGSGAGAGDGEDAMPQRKHKSKSKKAKLALEEAEEAPEETMQQQQQRTAAPATTTKGLSSKKKRKREEEEDA